MVEEEAKICGSYIEAVLTVSDKTQLDPQSSAKLLSLPIIEKIQVEGMDYNLLPKNSELPV